MSTQLAKLPALSPRHLTRAAVEASYRQFSTSRLLRAKDDEDKSRPGDPPPETQRPLDPQSRQQLMSDLIQTVYRRHNAGKAFDTASTRPLGRQPGRKNDFEDAISMGTEISGEDNGNAVPATRPVRARSPRAQRSSGGAQNGQQDGRPVDARSPRAQRSNGGAQNDQQGGGPVDARSFGAQGRGGGDQTKQLGSSNSLRELQERLRSRQRQLGAGRRGAGLASQRARRRRRPGDQQQNQRRRRRRGDPQQVEQEPLDAPTKEYLLQQKEAERQKPVRYNPEPYTFETLKRTWPSFPVGESAATAGSVRDKLTWIGERYVGSFETPHELAGRIFEGKRVMFTSDEEKDQVMRLVKDMAEEKAKKLTERKKRAVEPEDMSFQPLSEKERKDLIGSLVAGQYDEPPTLSTQRSTYTEVQKNLRNNPTYYDNQSAQFINAVSQYLPKDGQAGQNRARKVP